MVYKHPNWQFQAISKSLLAEKLQKYPPSFTPASQEKASLLHFSELHVPGQPSYLLPLQLHFFAKLLNFHLQLFLLWQVFDVKSRHSSESQKQRSWPGTARSGAKDRGPKELCRLHSPPIRRPARVQLRLGLSSHQPSPVLQDLKTPDQFFRTSQ